MARLSPFYFCAFLLHMSAFSLTHVSTSPLKSLFIGREWEFMEDTFIIKPDLEQNKISSHLKRNIRPLALACAIGAGIYAGSSYVPEVLGNGFKAQDFTAYVGAPLFAILAGLASRKFGSSMIEIAADFKAVEEFVKYWPENKPFTPTQFHSTFDSYYALYCTDPKNSTLKKDSYELIRLVRRALFEHFPNKYENRLKELDTQHTFFYIFIGCDIVDLVRLTGEIVRAFFVSNNHNQNQRSI